MYGELLDFAVTLAREAGAVQLDAFRSGDLGVQTKSNVYDVVTRIDKECEALIGRRIAERFPDHALLGEEDGERGKAGSDWRWVVDPLDGTTNYSQGLPVFAVSIALQHRGETVVGVVFAPRLDELYTAVRGGGAWLAERGKEPRRIRVARKESLASAVLATGFPYDKDLNPDNNCDNVASTVHLPVKTLVSMYFSNSEIVRLLGAVDRVVATDDTTLAKPTLLPEFQGLQNLGDRKAVNSEAVLATGADAYFTGSASTYSEYLEKDVGDSVDIIRLSAWEDNNVMVGALTLGYILGCTEKAYEYIDWCNEYIDLIAERTSGLTDRMTVISPRGGSATPAPSWRATAAAPDSSRSTSWLGRTTSPTGSARRANTPTTPRRASSATTWTPS